LDLISGLVFHTKNYKYNKCEHNCKIKDVWGEIIEKVAIIAMLALAIIAVPAMAQDASAMGGAGTDILGNGIFECGDNAFKFPILADTNFDSITVGDDNARAIGFEGMFPFFGPKAKAENNLEIKKNQQVGPCESCCKAGSPESCSACQSACTTVNIDNVKVGDRTAQAYGNAEAVNNVKLVLNQAR
jgi:hypothetical protein